MSDLIDRLKTALADRYAIEEEIGAGGMAIVYLAEDLKLHRQVALKVLRPELAAALGPERFLREIEIAAKLHHPHILPLHDSGEVDGFLYYVMPYVEGESLRDRLNREKQLPVEDALQIAREVADALGSAHRHDVIHRDIKPENILLEEGHAVVADFGIARAIHAAGGEHLTETGVSIGTPHYMSPEQCEGASDIDGRTDIYALGSVLYELLAGEPPYTGPTAQAIIAKRLTEPVPHVSTLRETVPPTVEAAINKALAKAPADRYATAGQLAEALDRRVVTASAPAETGTATAATRTRNVRRIAVSVSIGILALVGGWSILSNVIAPSSTALADEPEALLVLPFTLVGQEDDEFIAEGITEEVRSRLGKVAALKVLGRQTALRARAGAMTEQELGEEYDVDYVMDGTVRVQHLADGEIRLVVTPTLISTADGSQLWADTYDRSKSDMLAIQAEIAQSTVLALGAILGATEEQAVAARPTENPEAWEQYLQGEAIFRVAWPSQPQLFDAVEHYQRAIAADPQFALAYAQLSLTVSGMWRNARFSDERLSQAREAADSAMRLNADLPRAMLAMGHYHYACCRDYDRALEYILPAVERQPNDYFTVLALGTIRKRQGNFEEAARLYTRGADLDPFARLPAVESYLAYRYLREFEQANWYADRALAIRPRERFARLYKIMAVLSGGQDTETAWRVLNEGVSNNPNLSYGDFLAIPEWNDWGASARILCDARDCGAMVNLSHPDTDDPQQWRFYYRRMAGFLAATGEFVLSRRYYDSLTVVVEELSTREPDLLGLHSDLAMAYVRAGRSQDAMQEAQRAVERSSALNDALFVDRSLILRSMVFAVAGATDLAIEQLDTLLSGPSYISVNLLKLDPIWDPLRDNPRFQALLAKYEN